MAADQNQVTDPKNVPVGNQTEAEFQAQDDKNWAWMQKHAKKTLDDPAVHAARRTDELRGGLVDLATPLRDKDPTKLPENWGGAAKPGDVQFGDLSGAAEAAVDVEPDINTVEEGQQQDAAAAAKKKEKDDFKEEVTNLYETSKGDIAAFTKGSAELIHKWGKREADTNDEVRKVSDKLAKQEHDRVQKVHGDAYKQAQEGVKSVQESVRAYTRSVKTVNDALQQGINPNQFWHDRGAFARVIGAISIGLGAFAATETGQPNFALNIINDAIDRDVEAQLQNMNLYQQALDNVRNNVTEVRTAQEYINKIRNDYRNKRVASISKYMDTKRGNIAAWGQGRMNQARFQSNLVQENFKAAQKNKYARDLETHRASLRPKGTDALKRAQAFETYQQTRDKVRINTNAIGIPGLPKNTELVFRSPEAQKKTEGDITTMDNVMRNVKTGTDALVNIKGYWRSRGGMAKLWDNIRAGTAFPSDPYVKNVIDAVNNFKAMAADVVRLTSGDTSRFSDYDRKMAEKLFDPNKLDGFFRLQWAGATNYLTQVEGFLNQLGYDRIKATSSGITTRVKGGKSIFSKAQQMMLKGKETTFEHRQRVINDYLKHNRIK